MDGLVWLPMKHSSGSSSSTFSVAVVFSRTSSFTPLKMIFLLRTYNINQFSFFPNIVFIFVFHYHSSSDQTPNAKDNPGPAKVMMSHVHCPLSRSQSTLDKLEDKWSSTGESIGWQDKSLRVAGDSEHSPNYDCRW